MKATLRFKDLLRSPVGKNAGDIKLCQILDNLLRTRLAIVKGAPNPYEAMTQSGRKSPHIQLPHEETYLYHVHPAGGGCLVREEELETGSSVDEVEKVILTCRNSRELKQDVTNKLMFRPDGGQPWLRDYDNILVITDLLFALLDEGARTLGLLEAQTPISVTEPQLSEPGRDDTKAYKRGSYRTEKRAGIKKVLEEIFGPSGRPPEDMPDAEVVRVVTISAAFKAMKVHVHDDTILRAAGRRK